MDTTSSTPVVKEFRFYPESGMVSIVFSDDTTDDFTGKENYHAAHHAAIQAKEAPTPELDLTDRNGNTITVSVPTGTPHETFDL
jgi:hypothetical protein